MREKLTASALKKVTPKLTPYEIVDTEIKGFLLRVQPSGRMTYYFSYRNSEGLKKRIKIGVAGTVSARQARDSALTHAGQVSSGVDIQEEKKSRRQEAEANRKKTLGQFIEDHYRPWVLSNQKSGQASLDTLKRNFEPWYDRILTNISVLDVEQWRTKRLDAGKRPTTVNRITATLRAVMSKAEAWGTIDHHPLAKLKPLKTDTSPQNPVSLQRRTKQPETGSKEKG